MLNTAFRFILLAHLSAFISLGASADALRVLLDPGHGGVDRGTTKEHIFESEINLKISQQLKALLKEDPRFKVKTTRENDTTVSLAQRAQQAVSQNADILLSIHVNSSPEGRARGAEFYFQNQLAPDEESMYLAHQESADGLPGELEPYPTVLKIRSSPEVKAIVNDLLDSSRVLQSSFLSKNLKKNWSGYKKINSHSRIRQAPFFVLSQARIPAALVEVGFLTNSEDYKDLTNPVAQKRMAQNIYSALIEYKESIDKNSARH